jgi:hypothetical protein
MNSQTFCLCDKQQIVMIFGGITAKTDGQESPHKQLCRKHIHAGLEN